MAAIRQVAGPAALAALVLTGLTGILFPLALTAIVRPLFTTRADGSLVTRGDVVIGSDLIGQDFRAPGYFHSRPSAAGRGYDAAASGGTNLSPTNPKLWVGTADDPATHDVDETFAGIRTLAEAYRHENGLPPDATVPVDAVTRSGSGLDPHISPSNAALQIPRVARARRLSEESVRRLVVDHTQGRQFGILGEPRVSVLALNRALDRGDQGASSARPGAASDLPVAGGLEDFAFLALVVGLAWPIGLFLVRVFERRRTPLDFALVPVERVLHGLLRVRPEQEMSAAVYTLSFVAFGALGALLLFMLLLLQASLAGGPALRYLTTAMTPELAANIAASFATTTTWQSYGGETTLRYVTQVVGLAAQNFLGAAAGLAVGFAFMRGFARTNSPTVGNFWVDLVRALLWVLLPLSLVGGVVLVWQGVPLNLAPYTTVHTLEGSIQMIAQGPVAVLEIIKNLGTNGGGFFNVNGAHPYANPTPLTNLLGLLAIAVLPAALPIAFGRLTGRLRAGWVLLAVMVVLFTAGLAVCEKAESSAPAAWTAAHIAGGNMEGKEVRFGVHGSALAATVTSNGATGSNNSMHGSFQPIGVLVLLVNMLLGEVIFGGLGSGLYGIVMIALIGVFLSGLMIGRTPEYLGKAVSVRETRLVALYAILAPAVVMSLTAVAVATGPGRVGLVTNHGARGFTEILFAFTSCVANNGQAMAGLNANSLFYNLATVPAMLIGRFGLAAVALALAGRVAAQGRRPVTVGTMPCDTALFGALVLSTIVIVGGVCFLPALALGPIADFLLR
jgi:K+-transporting ATPase ATPase A chain